MTDDGWAESAGAWIADMDAAGGFGRQWVLDPAMLARVGDGPVGRVLDIGCGEGRFCRMLAARGGEVTGLEPTVPLLEAARARHPEGRYVEGKAEALPFADASFDIVVSYLSLIDIPDVRAAIPEMARALAPGGRLLVAHLNGFNTAAQAPGLGWQEDDTGGSRFYAIDNYSTESVDWVEWRGIRVLNHHRPLGAYMQLFIDQGLVLTHFSEPLAAPGAPAARAARYARAPWFCMMEWRKPNTHDRQVVGA